MGAGGDTPPPRWGQGSWCTMKVSQRTPGREREDLLVPTLWSRLQTPAPPHAAPFTEGTVCGSGCKACGATWWSPQASPIPRRRLVTKSCPTLCDPVDCGPPGSSIHRIL